MTQWDNTPTGIHNPEGVIEWLRANITAIIESTPLTVQMTQNDSTKVQILDVSLTLSAQDITDIETQFPELVGKITP